MFTKEQIEHFIHLAKTGDNNDVKSAKSISEAFVLARSLVDRWELRTTTFLINSEHAQAAKTETDSRGWIIRKTRDYDNVFGVKTYYLDIVPKNCIVALALNQKGNLVDELEDENNNYSRAAGIVQVDFDNYKPKQNKIEMTCEQYYERHKYCPKCNSKNIVCQMSCIIPLTKEYSAFRDTSGAACQNCAWQGIFHELHGEPPNVNKHIGKICG